MYKFDSFIFFLYGVTHSFLSMTETHQQIQSNMDFDNSINKTDGGFWSAIGFDSLSSGNYPETRFDYCDWDYMTNGTGGCAETGKRDVPLTASIEDGKLYSSEAWDNYAWRWATINHDKTWVDSEHKSFTMTVMDIERANNPQPFEDHAEPPTETNQDYESLSDRSEDHLENKPHSTRWEEVVEYNNQAVKELNKEMRNLKKDIHALRFEEIIWRKEEYPLLVQKLSHLFQISEDSMKEDWKLAIDEIKASSCPKSRSIIEQLLNFYDTLSEEYDIGIKEANHILHYRLYNIQEAIESPTTFEDEDWINTDPFVIELLGNEVEELAIQKETLLNKPFRIHKHLFHFMRIYQLQSNPDTPMYTPLSITLDISTNSGYPKSIGESDDLSFSKLSHTNQIKNIQSRILNMEKLLKISSPNTPEKNDFFSRLRLISYSLSARNSESGLSKLREGLYNYVLL